MAVDKNAKTAPPGLFGLGKPFDRFVAIAGTVVGVTLGALITFDLDTVKGNEIAVKETFFHGVSPDPVPPRTYFRNRFLTSFYHYDMTTKVFVMNDIPSPTERGEGRDNDPYLVQSADQQDMHISFNVRWHLDPKKIVDVHKNYHAYVGAAEERILEERLIRPSLMLIVKNHATKRKAMEAYSGDGLVQLQADIERQCADPNGELASRGVIIENFVIEKISLDPNYTAEIKARQIAQQKKLRADEETKAAEAEAIKAKAVAQADLNRAVVEAERDKQVAILKAEREAKTQVVAAEAEAQRVKISADAEKAAADARATAKILLGEADAKAQTLLFTAYSAPGAETYAQIQIAESMGKSFAGIQGYLPQNMSVNLLSENFMNSVRNFMRPGQSNVVLKTEQK